MVVKSNVTVTEKYLFYIADQEEKQKIVNVKK